MADRQLPREFAGPLTFTELSRALESLEGEYVNVRVTAGVNARGIVDVFGVLASSRTRDAGCLRLRVGDAGHLRLDDEEIDGITMTTMDGNDYFQIVIRLGGTTVAIADPEIQGLALLAGS